MPDDLKVLYEDNHIIAVNKGNSDIVQGDITGDMPLSEKMKIYLKEKYQKPGNVYVGVPHRLDRPVSGVLLMAKTSKALTRLNNMFRDGEIRKEYLAITGQKPPNDSGELVHYLTRNPKKNKSFTSPQPNINAKEAKLGYQFLAASDRYFLLNIRLKTGRHHQIRAQLAAMGCPIKGDLKYGFSRSNPDGGINLHAYRLQFVHPVKKEMVEILAKPPENEKLWKVFPGIDDIVKMIP